MLIECTADHVSCKLIICFREPYHEYLIETKRFL